MENGTLTVGALPVGRRGIGVRASAVIAAFALVLTMFVLVQQRADAAPAASVAVAAAVVGVGAADAAQIDFRQIVCPILLSIRNAFANSPFAGFILPIINSLIVAFGCAPS